MQKIQDNMMVILVVVEASSVQKEFIIEMKDLHHVKMLEL